MNSILPQAVNLLSYINSGETFIIKDLFPNFKHILYLVV